MTDLESRLENWGSWSRRQMLIYEQCESLEGDYRSPQSEHWLEGRAPTAGWVKPEDRDAYEVSLAAATLAFRDHLTLKLGYVRKMEDYRVAEVLTKELRQRVKTRDMLNIYYEAKRNLQGALKMPKVIRRSRTVERIRLLLPRTVDMMVD